MRRFIFLSAVFLLCADAWARELDGRLGLVVLPNEARPVLVGVGESFEVLARGQARLTLESSGASLQLSVAWRPVGGDLLQGTCFIASDFPAGRYTLRASEGEREDVAPRSVFVYETFPESYTVAVVCNPRMGAAGAETRFRRSVDAIEDSGAALVLITGEFSAAGTTVEFVEGLKILETLGVPIFISGAPSERTRDFLGPMPFAFRFGPDGYLAHYFSTGEGLDLGGRAGSAHRLRRSIRAARWSVGVGGAYRLDGALRDQLVLFHDDPLDVWVASSGGDAQSRVAIPWGKTTGYGVAEDAESGTVLFFEVGSAGVRLLSGAE